MLIIKTNYLRRLKFLKQFATFFFVDAAILNQLDTMKKVQQPGKSDHFDCQKYQMA